MTVVLLIHAIVRQTTVLIAQLATAGGVRAPLAPIANQVFLDLVRELERQGVSRKISADMFGMGLRSYRRKIQRLGESESEPGQGTSLWEAVLGHIRERQLVSRKEVLERFVHDDEAQVRAVLHDLCESQLVFTAGSGPATTYRAATDKDIAHLLQRQGSDGSDDLLLAMMNRESAQSTEEVAKLAHLDESAVQEMLDRLQAAGRVERGERQGQAVYRAPDLTIPIGAPAGWEAAVFDHYKALVGTVLGRLNRNPTAVVDRVGGSTYTIEVWPGHPLAEEVYGTLGRLRGSLGELRERVRSLNETLTPPTTRSRVVVYAGQSVIDEDHDDNEQDAI